MKVALAVAVAILAASVSPARAATVSVTGTAPNKVVTFQAEPGEYNFPFVRPIGDSTVEFEDFNGIVAGEGCGVVQNYPKELVDCSGVGAAAIEIHLGDQNDDLGVEGGDLPVVAFGGPGNDLMEGDHEADEFHGDAGDDTFIDRVSGSSDPADSYFGGDGVDTADYSSRTDPLNISLDNVANDGGTGENDNVRSDIEQVSSGSGADTLVGNDAANTLSGGAGGDHIDGQGGDDVISENTPSGPCGGNTLIGGDGNDVIRTQGGGDVVQGGPGDDSLSDGSLADGGCSGAGDSYSGGPGTDLVIYWGTAPVDLTLDDVANDGRPGENDNVQSDVEDLRGGWGADHLVGDSAGNHLDGSYGDDLIEGGGGNDTLDGSEDQDTLLGDAGDDTLNGGTGDDSLDGGADSDTLNGDPGSDQLDGGPGDDTLTGGAADATLDGEYDDDTLNGGDGADTLNGGPGQDVLDGGADGDTLDGQFGADVLDGGPGADIMSGGDGEDVADYSSRSQSVYASIDGIANDGEAGEDDNIAADVEDIWGGSGDDVLAGGAGDNLLDGGPGADQMTGGGGIDGVDYSTRTADVTVDLDGSPGNDGEAGEGDTVGADIEGIIGGSGDDTLTGNAADGFLYGNDGNDELIDPGGEDYVDGGDGDDELQTRDGAEDSDVCGDGFDSVVGDANDDLPFDDCESVDGPVQPPETGGGGGGAGGGGGTVTPPPHHPRLPRPPRVFSLPDRIAPVGSLALASTPRLAKLRSRGLRLTVSCNEPCSVTAMLTSTFIGHRARKASRITLARATLPSGPAGRRALKLVLSRRGKRALRGATTVRARLTVVLADPAGNQRRLSRSVVFRR